MRYGIFSDVHSNLEALEAVLAAYKKEAIDKYFCVGDIVGYGADPCQCLKIVKEINAVCVAGNHDWGVSEKLNLDNFTSLAKEGMLKNAKQLSSGDKRYLDSLELTYENEDLTLVHGTLQNAEGFHYLNSDQDAVWTARLMQTNVCFIGHTHKPRIFEFCDDSYIHELFQPCFKINSPNKYIVNVGSVGQPRCGDPRAIYAIFDTEAREICMKRTTYDVTCAQKKIKDAGLPKFLADRLLVGR